MDAVGGEDESRPELGRDGFAASRAGSGEVSRSLALPAADRLAAMGKDVI